MTDAASRETPASALAVIPARLASARLPGKPLLDRTGRPLIAHVIDRVLSARSIERVVVATDDERIAEAARQAGAEARLTRADHPNGTSRIAEAVDQLEAEGLPAPEWIVNVQGDEPEVEPEHIDRLVAAAAGAGDAPMATLAARWDDANDPANPNVVKVVADANGDALYFSRAPIPHDRDERGIDRLHHVGLYAYRRAFLSTFVNLAPTPHEQAERLEQLRALEHGHRIRVAIIDHARPGIDTPEQYDAFVARYHTQSIG
ncbi:MAG: 3-deoxy-manno-octulosonate cytidylyltransferase [Planctomycetota bacterium]